MNKIRALQLGNCDWNTEYTLSPELELHYAESYTEPAEKEYDLVFWDRPPAEEELEALSRSFPAYTLYVTAETGRLSSAAQELFMRKKGQYLKREDIPSFLTQEVKFYFSGSYGEKYHMCNLDVSRNFQGSVCWNGQYALILNGFFGEDFQQAVFWKNTLPIKAGQTLDLWLEYKKTPGVEISLMLTRVLAYSVSEIIGREEIPESRLQEIMQITAGSREERLFLSIQAKGEGELQIIALHDRVSRGSHGYFLPGGERYVSSEKEEVFCYFEPMDCKPPLNVYFSGYKTKEGFEGYYMMRNMGAPFLLIAETRLEGGCFYRGTQEYEALIRKVIEQHREELQFSPDEVILSGISMGTHGALYYGCDLQPHALILGKPLVNLGNVAVNEKWKRPEGFPTSLDVLNYLGGGLEQTCVKKLNDGFWDRFSKADWHDTKIVAAYMLEDDYDCTAYRDLLEHISSGGIRLYGKGIHGRHNDDTAGIIRWFVDQYKQMLREDFGRLLE